MRLSTICVLVTATVFVRPVRCFGQATQATDPTSPAAVSAIRRADKAIADAEAAYRAAVTRAKRAEVDALRTAMATAKRSNNDAEAAAIAAKIADLNDEIQGKAPADKAPAAPRNVLIQDHFEAKDATAYLTAAGFVRRSSVHDPLSTGVTGMVYDGTKDVWEKREGAKVTTITILYLGAGPNAWAGPDHVTTEEHTDAR
jgi:cell pole-organizing protein PopZ